ncbi:MAG TPA: hypothetical protein VF177_07365 [Anaerolineae bacterium]
MLTTLIRRLVIGFCFAVPLGLLSASVSEASVPRQEPLATECQECHASTQSDWQNGAHGREDIACAVCHTVGSNGTSHPEQIMQTDVSSRFCGTCHVGTFADLETSAHGQENLGCNRCHNPHTTDLKSGSVQETCQACHSDESHFFTYTAHAREGLLCTDCHLRVSDSPSGEGHSQRLHTFAVDLSTCNQCHNQEMHYPMPGQNAMVSAVDPISAGSTLPAATTPVNPEPTPASPFNFALLAALLGMAFGLVGSPWLERRLQNE